MRHFGTLAFAATLFSLACTCRAVSPILQAKDLAGTWQGALSVGGTRLRLVLILKKEVDGTYSGTMDSIDQQAMGIPISKASYLDGKVRIEVDSVKGHYEGLMSADGSAITGTWTQGETFPLDLVRDSKLPVTKRPQNPVKPYPYLEHEVTYVVGTKDSLLAATLTVPRGKGPFPAVVLITGSGPQNRDEALMGHRPFLVLSDYLTRRGIAVLRADDRGVGKSKGSFDEATTLDFSWDAEAGVRFLAGRKEIDPKRIGLIGHSEGGLIAPMVAARCKQVAFIVLMAGTGVDGQQIVDRQGALIAKASGASDAEIAATAAVQKRLFGLLRTERDPTVREKKAREMLGSTYDGLPDSDRKKAGPREAFILGQVRSVLTPWFEMFLTLDPTVALRKVKCPVLAINGEKDLQVDPTQNIAPIAAALRAGGNKRFTTKVLPNLNHLFQTCKTGSPSEYAQIEETISPGALKVMGDWLTTQTRPTRRLMR